MGYTHYWRGNESKIDASAWPAAIADCDRLVAAGKEPYGLDIAAVPEFVEFNGDATKDHDHEPFSIPRDANIMQRTGFEFCKTACKPYDVVVTACLARLAEAGLYVSSDGSSEDWLDGLTFAEEILSRPLAYPVSRDE